MARQASPHSAASVCKIKGSLLREFIASGRPLLWWVAVAGRRHECSGYSVRAGEPPRPEQRGRSPARQTGRLKAGGSAESRHTLSAVATPVPQAETAGGAAQRLLVLFWVPK